MKNFIWKQFIVGLIVVIGLGLFVGLTIIISNNYGSLFRSSQNYKSIFNSSDGLNIGSEITFHGARTGNIIGMTLISNGTIEIIYTVRKSHSFMVNQDTKAGLKNKGLLGDRYINLATVNLEAPSIPVNSIIPVMKTADISSVIKSIEKFVSRLEETVKAGGSNKDFHKLSSVVSSLDSILKKVDKGQGSLGAIINNRNLYNRLLILLGEKPRNSYLRDLSNKPKK